jgi:hypothetical protein
MIGLKRGGGMNAKGTSTEYCALSCASVRTLTFRTAQLSSA